MVLFSELLPKNELHDEPSHTGQQLANTAASKHHYKGRQLKVVLDFGSETDLPKRSLLGKRKGQLLNSDMVANSISTSVDEHHVNEPKLP